MSGSSWVMLNYPTHRFASMISWLMAHASSLDLACKPISKNTHSLISYLEKNVRCLFQTIIIDYIKDQNGQWWFLQVKAFRLRAPPIPRCLHSFKKGQTAKLKDTARGESQVTEGNVERLHRCRCCEVRNEHFASRNPTNY
jgi:hypothetical protein